MPNNPIAQPNGAPTDGSRPLRRSYLFVPGSRPDRFTKAMEAGSDAVIIDLEDAVAPGDKDRARGAVRDFLRQRPSGGPELFVRVNAVRSRTGLADLLALTEGTDGLGCAGFLLPKADAASDLRLAAGLLDEQGLPGELGALIESAEGLENVMEIAAGSGPRLSFLMFGGADLSAELRVNLAWEPLVHARARIVHAAARFALDAVDMPWIFLDDEEGYRQELARSVALGFTARAAIHPKQVAAIHESLMPPAEAVARAERVLAAFEAAGGGVCTLDGKLVEKPVVLTCRRILAIARRAQGGEGRW